MALSGVEIYKYFQLQNDIAYTDYLDTTKANRLFYRATINVIEDIYTKKLENQNAFDQLTYLIATDQVFSVNSTTNTIYIGTTSITVTNITYSTVTSTITTSLPHDLQTGMSIKIVGVVSTGTLAATLNGNTYVVTVTGANTFTVSTSPTTPTGTYTSGGTITLPISILDYDHYLFGKAKFTDLTDYSVIASTSGAPIRITLDVRSKLRTGDRVTIAGISGNTNANGTFYLKQGNDYTYTLYSDANLRTPVAGNGTQTGIGTVTQIYYTPLKFKRSDEKGGRFGIPSVQNPYFQENKRFLTILPKDQPCTEITIDYIRKPPLLIDVSNSTVDYLNYYDENFLYDVCSMAGILLAESMRDTTLLNVDTNEYNRT